MTVEELVPDGLWEEIAPLLGSAASAQRWPSASALRNVVAGIVYVLRTGVPWRDVPARELGCGSGVTCWRRLVEWQQAGVWERLLERCHAAGRLAWSAPIPPIEASRAPNTT
jgi:transposase